MELLHWFLGILNHARTELGATPLSPSVGSWEPKIGNIIVMVPGARDGHIKHRQDHSRIRRKSAQRARSQHVAHGRQSKECFIRDAALGMQPRVALVGFAATLSFDHLVGASKAGQGGEMC